MRTNLNILLISAATAVVVATTAESQDDVFVPDFESLPRPAEFVTPMEEEPLSSIEDDTDNNGLEKLQHMIATLLNDTDNTMDRHERHFLKDHIRGGMHHLRRPCHDEVLKLCSKEIKAELADKTSPHQHLRVAKVATTCLANNLTSLTDVCKKAIDTIGKRHGDRPHPPPHAMMHGGQHFRADGKLQKRKPEWEFDSSSSDEGGFRPRPHHGGKRPRPGCGGRFHRPAPHHVGFGLLLMFSLIYTMFRMAKKCSRPSSSPLITLAMPRFMTRNSNNNSDNARAPAYAPPFVASGRPEYVPVNHDDDDHHEGAYYA